MNEPVIDIYDIDNTIRLAIKNKTLVPRAVYNIKLRFGKLELLIDTIVNSSNMSMKDHDDSISIMRSAMRRGVCRLLLSFGLPMLDNERFYESFSSTLIMWLEAGASKHSLLASVSMEEGFEILLTSEIVNFLSELKKDIYAIDKDVIDISDFYSYIEHDYMSINDYVMYKSFNDEVISILRF